ncbi:MAG TPA: beta-N-acetylhexosaminidase [Candidatus Sulfotelmatobacter sp.]|nr:beta-N-acetylhexosaminidase [Candidatus Sulfotelmatobacter sp.]
MKKFFLAGLLLATGFCNGYAELDLIPLPTRIEQQTGHFMLDSRTVIIADSLFTNEAALIAGELGLTNANSADKNRILLTTGQAEGLGAEGYRLEVNRQGVNIHALSPAGAFYGCQTLRQLIEPRTKEIPCVKIEDTPRYEWRGLMLDVSRHFFDKPTILQLLDWMADYKLNRLHLHLTDDQAWRLEIKKYPELTSIGARGNYSDANAPPQFFTDDEMRDIIEYAARRHIVVVPEIDMPGHAGAATRTFPQLDGGARTFNPAHEETYDFLQDVLTETMEIFPSPWIHLGGDEVNRSAWNQNTDVQKKLRAGGMKNTQQLEDYFVNRMAEFIEAHGRTPMGWDEIIAARPDANAVIFWWRHDKPEMLVRALAGGHRVVLTPRSPCYFDYPQDKSYPEIGWKLFNTPEAVYRGPVIPANIPATELKQILGVEACIWTEHIASVPYLEFMTIPRMAALAEMAWTPDRQRNFARFDQRLQPFLDQYRQLGIHYYDETDPAGSLHASRQLPDAAQNLSFFNH